MYRHMMYNKYPRSVLLECQSVPGIANTGRCGQEL